MPRLVRIATTSFDYCTLRSPEDNRSSAAHYADVAGAAGCDLLCLPEHLQDVGVPRERRRGTAEPIPGPTFDALAAGARRNGVYVVAGLKEQRGARTYNTAVLIDRLGRLVGQYDKVHPVIGECDEGVVPGRCARVLETDFGRVGLAICFDIGWPEVWAQLGEQRAELVVWPSAYSGGFPLRCYAWLHQYYIVTAVWSGQARVIDITGEELGGTSRWAPLLLQEINLDKHVFHIGYQEQKLQTVTDTLGSGVRARHYRDEDYCTLESRDPDWPLSRVMVTYGLETFRDYHARSTQVQDTARDRDA